MVPSVQLARVNKQEDFHEQIYDIEALMEKRKIQERWYLIKQ